MPPVVQAVKPILKLKIIFARYCKDPFGKGPTSMTSPSSPTLTCSKLLIRANVPKPFLVQITLLSDLLVFDDKIFFVLYFYNWLTSNFPRKCIK